MKHYEDAEQAALFEWAAYYPELRWLFSIPNGGNRNIREAKRLVKQGVKAGVSDVFLPIPRRPYSGLFIEMKRSKADGRSKITQDQGDFMMAMTHQKYKCVVCYGFVEATNAIKDYLGVGGLE